MRPLQVSLGVGGKWTRVEWMLEAHPAKGKAAPVDGCAMAAGAALRMEGGRSQRRPGMIECGGGGSRWFAWLVREVGRGKGEEGRGQEYWVDETC